MRNQTELKFFIGYPEKNETFDKCVIELASKLCGGCFIAQGNGYWMEDGAEHKTLFTGSLASEYCLCVVLSCEDHKVADVLLSMKLGIAAHAGHMQIETDWVHVQKTAFEGLHFSVQETYNAMPRNVVRDFVSPGTRGARR